MEPDPDDVHYDRDPKSPAPSSRRPTRRDHGLDDLARAEAEHRRADEDRSEAVRDAIRAEQLTRDADHARHLAELSDDPAVQRQARSRAYEAGHQAAGWESDAAGEFRAADAGYRAASADLGSARAMDPRADDVTASERRAEEAQAEAEAPEPEYDSPQRREQLAGQLESHGIDHEVVASRVRADVGQARPATAISRRVAARAQTLRGASTARRRVRQQQPRRAAPGR